MLYLFVYGTLQAGHRNHHVLGDTALSSTPASTPGWELWHLSPNEHPAILHGDAMLHGTLFIFSEEDHDAVLTRCDQLEDYYPERPTESRYIRESVLVTTADGETFDAYIYAWNPLDADTLRTQHTLIAHGDWCAFMEAKKEHES